jgi:hypothetical protein
MPRSRRGTLPPASGEEAPDQNDDIVPDNNSDQDVVEQQLPPPSVTRGRGRSRRVASVVNDDRGSQARRGMRSTVSQAGQPSSPPPHVETEETVQTTKKNRKEVTKKRKPLPPNRDQSGSSEEHSEEEFNVEEDARSYRSLHHQAREERGSRNPFPTAEDAHQFLDALMVDGKQMAKDIRAADGFLFMQKGDATQLLIEFRDSQESVYKKLETDMTAFTKGSFFYPDLFTSQWQAELVLAYNVMRELSSMSDPNIYKAWRDLRGSFQKILFAPCPRVKALRAKAKKKKRKSGRKKRGSSSSSDSDSSGSSSSQEEERNTRKEQTTMAGGARTYLNQIASGQGQLGVGSSLQILPAVQDLPEFVCNEPLRSQLLTDSRSHKKLNLGGKTLPVFINETIIQTSKRFTGLTNDQTIQDVWERLREIHEAPTKQLSYFQKTQSLLQCLEGPAAVAVAGYRSATSRLYYLQAWKTLFTMYGNREAEVSNIYNEIRNCSVKNSSWSEGHRALIQINSLLVRVGLLGQEYKLIAYTKAWDAIEENLHDKFKEFLLTGVQEFGTRYGGHPMSYITANAELHFHQFFSWYQVRANTENCMAGVISHSVKRSQPVNNASDSSDEEVRKDQTEHQKRDKKKRAQSGEPQKRDTESFPLRKAKSEPKMGLNNPCFLCKKHDHPWTICPELDLAKRRAVFAKESRCLKCATPGHRARECKSDRSCFHCKRNDHHSTICQKKFDQQKRKADSQGESAEKSKNSKKKADKKKEENQEKEKDKGSSQSKGGDKEPTPSTSTAGITTPDLTQRLLSMSGSVPKEKAAGSSS